MVKLIYYALDGKKSHKKTNDLQPKYAILHRSCLEHSATPKAGKENPYSNLELKKMRFFPNS